MAQIDISQFNNNFALSESPMVVRLHALNFGVNSDGTPSLFRQVLLEVTTYYDSVLTGSDAKIGVHTFPVPVDHGATEVVCDISSAIRSSLARYQHPADGVVPGNTIVYPNCSFKLKAWEREMINGEVEDAASTSYPNSEDAYLHAGLGGMSQYERWKNPNVNSDIKFSTKPSGEIYGRDQIYCTSLLQGGRVETTVSAVESGVVDTRNRVTFLFVNSRGVFETISVLPYESLSYEIVSSRKSLSQLPSYQPKPNATTHKQGGVAVWQMSSGFVSRDWTDWYASEFLMAKRYWIHFDGAWLPVTVEPLSDQVVVYDREDPSLIHVPFQVRAAVSGSVR